MFKDRRDIFLFLAGAIGITVYYMYGFLDAEVKEVINTCLFPVFVFVFVVLLPKSPTVMRFFQGIFILRSKVKKDIDQKVEMQSEKLNRDAVVMGKIFLRNLFSAKNSLPENSKNESGPSDNHPL